MSFWDFEKNNIKSTSRTLLNHFDSIWQIDFSLDTQYTHIHRNESSPYSFTQSLSTRISDL